MSVKHVAWVWEHSRAEGGTLLVALALADSVNYLDSSDECWPKQSVLAERCRLSERQVSRCIAELVDLGEIEKQRVQNGNRYRFIALGAKPSACGRSCADPTCCRHDSDDDPSSTSGDSTTPVSEGLRTPTSGSYVETEVETEVRNGKEPTAELFAEWLSLSGQPKAHLSPGRQRQIRKLFNEEPDVAILKRALQGYALHVKRSSAPDRRWEISDAFSTFRGKDGEGKPVFGDLRSRINWLLSISVPTNGELSTEAISRLMEAKGLDPNRGLRWLDEVRYHLEKQAISPGSSAGRERAVEAFQKLRAAGFTVERLSKRPYATVKR